VRLSTTSLIKENKKYVKNYLLTTATPKS